MEILTVVSARSKDSETAHMRGVVRAFNARISSTK